MLRANCHLLRSPRPDREHRYLALLRHRRHRALDHCDF